VTHFLVPARFVCILPHMKKLLDESNPIVAAVLPLKSQAQDRAEQWARERIAKVLAEPADCVDWEIYWGANLSTQFPAATPGNA
jgi:hypothetical protein